MTDPVAALWSRGDYAQLAENLVPMAADLVRTTAIRSGALAGRRVVDIATGTGNVALLAAHEGADVTGVDITADLVEVAHRRAEQAGVSVTWRVADAVDTGLPAESFDVAMSCVGLIFVADHDAAVEELARLLAPGGVFGMTSWVPTNDDPMGGPLRAFLPDRPAAPMKWGMQKYVRARLADHFSDIVISERIHHWTYASAQGAVDDLLTTSPLHVGAMSAIPEEHHDRVRAGFLESFERHVGPDGTGRLDLPYLVTTAGKRHAGR